MISLLFLLAFVAMVLTMVDKHKCSFMVFGVAMLLSLLWFRHHATDTLNILL
jgi:hypothetical protein